MQTDGMGIQMPSGFISAVEFVMRYCFPSDPSGVAFTDAQVSNGPLLV